MSARIPYQPGNNSLKPNDRDKQQNTKYRDFVKNKSSGSPRTRGR
ncbi:hypothetical protein [Candidatus Orientia mediorientalis]|nr:hypothetical protein [Candidatus Orientia mediorientalis]